MNKLLLSLFLNFFTLFTAEQPLKIIERNTQFGPVIFQIFPIQKAIEDEIKFEKPITEDDINYIKVVRKKTGTVLAHCKTTTAPRGDGVFISNEKMVILLPYLQIIAASLRKKIPEPKKKQSPQCTLL